MAHEVTQERGADRRPPRAQIFINGRKKTVNAFELSFEQLVDLAFETPPSGENVSFVITFQRGPKENPKGVLNPGESVAIKDGMVFNVRHTDKS